MSNTKTEEDNNNKLLELIPKNIPFFGNNNNNNKPDNNNNNSKLPAPPSMPPPLTDSAVSEDDDFEATPEFLIAKAKSVIATDLAIQDPTLLDDVNFRWIGPLVDTPLGKVEYLAAGRFFDVRASFPDLEYRAHDFRLDANDPTTVRCTVRPLGTMRGSPLRLRNQLVPANGVLWNGPPEAVSITFDPDTGKVVKLCSSFCLDRQVGNTNGVCGVMAAATIAGVPPSDWEIYPPLSVLGRILGRPLYPLPETTTFLAPFPETVMIQLTKGILSSNLATDDASLLSNKEFSFLTPTVGPITDQRDFLENYALQELEGTSPSFTNFRVDPFDPNRVWVDVKVTGPAGLEGPPQAWSFTFDDDGFCIRITAGAVMDPSIGTTGGLAGPEGVKYHMGKASLDIFTRPLPLALGRIKINLLSPITKTTADDWGVMPSADAVEEEEELVKNDIPPSPLAALQESFSNTGTNIFDLNTNTDDDKQLQETTKEAAAESRKKALQQAEEAAAAAAEQRRLQAEARAAAAAEKQAAAAAAREAAAEQRRAAAEAAAQQKKQAAEAAEAQRRLMAEEQQASQAQARKQQQDQRRAAAAQKKRQAEAKQQETQRLLQETERRKAAQAEARQRTAQLESAKEERRVQAQEKKAAQAALLQKKAQERRALAEEKKRLAQEQRAAAEAERREKLERLQQSKAAAAAKAKVKTPVAKSSGGFFSFGRPAAARKTNTSTFKKEPVKRPTRFTPKPKLLAKAPNGVPTIVEWRSRRDGGISGRIFGSRNFSEGEKVETSPISKGEIQNGMVVTTESGSRYFLSNQSRRELLNQIIQSKPVPKELANAQNSRATIQLTQRKKEQDAKAALETLKTAKPRATLSLAAFFGDSSSSEDDDTASSTVPPKGVPELRRWKQNSDDQSITGFVTGSSSFRRGEKITTSPIRRGSMVASGEVVVTTSGSKYFLQ